MFDKPAYMKDYNKQTYEENKDFHRARAKKYRETHPEWVKQSNKTWNIANPERKRDLWYSKQYGITLDQYNQLLKSQNGLCALCLKPPSGTRRLAVDHSHKSGLVRGLLHSFTCNRRFIGSWEDPTLFRKAAEYLENPPAQQLFPGIRVPDKKKGGRHK